MVSGSLRRRLGVISALAVSVAGVPCFAKAAYTPLINQTLAAVRKGDAAATKRDVARIDALLTKNDPRGIHWAVNTVVHSLYNHKHYRMDSALTLKAILACPLDTSAVQLYQDIRMRCLIGLGHKKQALAAARGLYNVAAFGRSDWAIKEVAWCLGKAHPKQKRLGVKFKLQQQAKAAGQTCQQAGLGKSLIQGIKVDPTPYTKQLQDFEWWKTPPGYLSAGNLLLLANEPKLAKAEFLDYLIASKTKADYLTAARGEARAMRAIHRGVYEANKSLATFVKHAPAK